MPGPFKFRLGVVQRLRKLELEREQRAMAGCVNAVLEARRLADLVAERLEENQRQKREIQRGAHPDVAALRAEQWHWLWLRRTQEQTQQELTKRQEIMDAQRQKLVAASRRVKVIEKLRDRQWKRHLDDQRRAERKEQDEFTLLMTAK